MNILEKNGKPIAVVLTTASAFAAGVSVYTAVSAQKHSMHPVAKAAVKARTSAELSDQYYIDENDETDLNEAPALEEDAAAEESVDETAQIPEQSVEEETIAVESEQVQPEAAWIDVQPAVDANAVLDIQPLAYEPAAAPVEVPVSEITPVFDPVYAAEEPEVSAPAGEQPVWQDADLQAPVIETEAPAVIDGAAADVQAYEIEEPAAEAALEQPEVNLEEAPGTEETGIDSVLEPAADAVAEEAYPAPIAEEALPNPVGEEIADTQPSADASWQDPAAGTDLSGEAVNAGAPVYGETLSSPTLNLQPVEEVPNAQYAELNARIAEEAQKLVIVTDGLQCTEVVQMAMANAGVVDAQSLWPRQYADTYGHITDSPEPGNLIYYNQGGDGLDHIAVYIGNNEAVHGNYDNGDGVSRTTIASVQVEGCTDYSYIQVER